MIKNASNYLSLIVFGGLVLICAQAKGQASSDGIVITPKRASEFRPFRLQLMSGFSASERRLLQEADRILNREFQDWSNIEQALSADSWLAERTKKLTRVEKCMPPEYRLGEQAVIAYQWIVLVAMQGFGGFGVEVYPYYSAEDGALAKAPVDVVDFDLDCDPVNGLSINGRPGQFKIRINRYYLPDTSAKELAGTVLHEILHNLGHQHPKRSRDRRWQINAFADALGLDWINDACDVTNGTQTMAAR